MRRIRLALKGSFKPRGTEYYISREVLNQLNEAIKESPCPDGISGFCLLKDEGGLK